MATVYLREGGWTDSSGTEVGSEYSEERQSLRLNQVFYPPSLHHFRSGLSMELDYSTWQLEQHGLAQCLIGYVADVRRFGSYLMQMHVNDLWHLEGSVHVYCRSKNHYVFLFERVGDMHRIVDNGPYAIQRALLIVDYWKPDLVLDRLIFDKMLVWVQLYGLPLECFTEKAGVRLGRAVGEVVKVDIDSLMPRNICLQQGTPERSESPPPIVQRDGVISPAFSPPNRLVESDVLSGLGQALVDSVGELEVMWHQWEGHLSSMGIRPGQLVAERVGELTASPRQEQYIYYSSLNGPNQSPLLASTEDVLRAIQINGPGPRLKFSIGEALITTRAFVRKSSSNWTLTGSANFEVGQSSSMIANGPQPSTVAAEIPTPTSSVSIVSGPLIRKRLRDMDSGFDLLYDTEPMFVIDTVRSPLTDGPPEFFLHSSSMVSDSMCPPQSLGSLLRKHICRRKKARYTTSLVLHGHAPAVPWPPRVVSARSMPQRRRRKLHFRSRHILAGTSSSMGFSSRRRQGQSSHASSGHRRGSTTSGLLVQDAITSESGYNTGVSSSEGCGLYYEVPQACAPSDLAQVTRFGSSLGFKNHCGMNCNRRAGGLWVGWHDDTLIEVCELNSNFIILQIHDSVRGNWFIIFMLVDLPSQGVWYTWCNNRKETEVVYERLDRVLASSSWTAIFSEFSLNVVKGLGTRVSTASKLLRHLPLKTLASFSAPNISSPSVSRIVGGLGGRAAEEMIFGEPEVTTSAAGDLQQITGLAKQMVTTFGMPEIDIDTTVKRLSDRAYEIALIHIRNNREAIDKIVEILLEKETIIGEEFIEIPAENPSL
ncbi:hypothetical protein LOK49_LG03G03291 [Camellia lanceoleosa]|uniref:Uncharacterized protein n=1 Tax=Camellia lanceoleosa TaxID=1840588 RepID=A0ACC0IGN0_9ERIC|nr:hypothetical protein LOK49_LG03G03291 [Camellia lanceoleosa]